MKIRFKITNSEIGSQYARSLVIFGLVAVVAMKRQEIQNDFLKIDGVFETVNNVIAIGKDENK